MTEIVFVVELAPAGGYTARALGVSIFTAADTEAQLREAVQDAVHCHFDEGKSPKVIRLHFVRDGLPVASRTASWATRLPGNLNQDILNDTQYENLAR